MLRFIKTGVILTILIMMNAGLASEKKGPARIKCRQIFKGFNKLRLALDKALDIDPKSTKYRDYYRRIKLEKDRYRHRKRRIYRGHIKTDYDFSKIKYAQVPEDKAITKTVMDTVSQINNVDKTIIQHIPKSKKSFIHFGNQFDHQEFTNKFWDIIKDSTNIKEKVFKKAFSEELESIIAYGLPNKRRLKDFTKTIANIFMARKKTTATPEGIGDKIKMLNCYNEFQKIYLKEVKRYCSKIDISRKYYFTDCVDCLQPKPLLEMFLVGSPLRDFIKGNRDVIRYFSIKKYREDGISLKSLSKVCMECDGYPGRPDVLCDEYKRGQEISKDVLDMKLKIANKYHRSLKVDRKTGRLTKQATYEKPKSWWEIGADALIANMGNLKELIDLTVELEVMDYDKQVELINSNRQFENEMLQMRVNHMQQWGRWPTPMPLTPVTPWGGAYHYPGPMVGPNY